MPVHAFNSLIAVFSPALYRFHWISNLSWISFASQRLWRLIFFPDKYRIVRGIAVASWCNFSTSWYSPVCGLVDVLIRVCHPSRSLLVRTICP